MRVPLTPYPIMRNDNAKMYMHFGVFYLPLACFSLELGEGLRACGFP